MKTIDEAGPEFARIATTSARLVFDGARELVRAGVDRDECVLAAAMLLIAHANIAGMSLEEAQAIVTANWEEGRRQLSLRGHSFPRRGRS